MRQPKPLTLRGFGIVNPYGAMWTTTIFDSMEAANRHLEEFGRSMKHWDARGFRIIPAEITIRALPLKETDQ